MAQKYTKARKEGNRKWDAANLDRLSIALPKGSRETIKAHAQAQGESVNGFIGRAISEAMERDSSSVGAAGISQWAGVVSLLPSETLKAAQEAAEAAGESLPQFIGRAVEETADRETAPKEVAFYNAVNLIAEEYKISHWDLLDELGQIKKKFSEKTLEHDRSRPAPSSTENQ